MDAAPLQAIQTVDHFELPATDGQFLLPSILAAGQDIQLWVGLQQFHLHARVDLVPRSVHEFPLKFAQQALGRAHQIGHFFLAHLRQRLFAGDAPHYYRAAA